MSSQRSERLPHSSGVRAGRVDVRSTRKPAAAAIAFVLTLFAFPLAATAQDLQPGWFCGELKNHFGPFDYRTAPRDKKEIVERFHFTSSVEALIKGNTGSLGSDIAYTLHAFPNHPRALAAMERLARRDRTPHAKGAAYSVECYFERAVRFQPDDAQVRVLYASYLINRNRQDEARSQIAVAEKLAPKDPSIVYNIGLVYADLGNYDKALSYAHKAYAAGIEVPGLRNKLQRAGRWRDASG